MPVRFSSHIQCCKILKADADWIDRVTKCIYDAVTNIRETTAHQIPDRQINLDLYLTLTDKTPEFSSVQLGIHVGRVRSNGKPVNVTLHYRAFDLRHKSDGEIATIIANDCDNALASVRATLRRHEHDEQSDAPKPPNGAF
jgi:hypothetical protein